MIGGIIFCGFGLIHGVIKYYVIRSAARDVFNGGGVPVMDFVIFVPLWFSIGTALLLKQFHIYPFPFFGVAAYFTLAIGLYSLMKFEYRRGRPEVERQLATIKAKKAAEQ